jgi:hypothetical protein
MSSSVPTPAQLAGIDDDELVRLAVSWRAQASRGDREAFGIAHALEVECRQRLRASQLQQLPAEPLPAARPWWKFWSGKGDPISAP